MVAESSEKSPVRIFAVGTVETDVTPCVNWKPLVVGEEERPVLLHRSAEAAAELILIELWLRSGRAK